MKKRKLKKYLISYGTTKSWGNHEFHTDFVFIDAYSKLEAFEDFRKRYDNKVIAITDMSD